MAPKHLLGGRLRDGAGVISDADWRPEFAEDMFGGLRQQWLRRVHAWDLVPRLVSHAATSSEVPLFVMKKWLVFAKNCAFFLSSKGLQCSSNVPSGQPLALHLLRGMLLLSDDVDADLPIQLERGVPTGIRETIPASGVWRPVEVPERPPVELLTWQEPWSAEWLAGGLAEARARFGTAFAAGRLGLVKKKGSAPRLVGDSTASGANLLCRIGERIEMPSLQDVSEFLSRDPDALWTAFIMDVSKAHKREKVAPEDCGFSLFAIIDSRGDTRWIMYIRPATLVVPGPPTGGPAQQVHSLGLATNSYAYVIF